MQSAQSLFSEARPRAEAERVLASFGGKIESHGSCVVAHNDQKQKRRQRRNKPPLRCRSHSHSLSPSVPLSYDVLVAYAQAAVAARAAWSGPAERKRACSLATRQCKAGVWREKKSIARAAASSAEERNTAPSERGACGWSRAPSASRIARRSAHCQCVCAEGKCLTSSGRLALFSEGCLFVFL